MRHVSACSLAAVLALSTTSSLSTPQTTALDAYIAAPDPAFAWKAHATIPVQGLTVTVLDLTSQRWLTDREVSQPTWKHWLTVVRPKTLTSDIALLFISGGSNGRPAPAKASPWLVDIARDTGTVVAELRQVPNQPLVFLDDPEKKERKEDDLIGYAWDHFLETGTAHWLPRFPMAKSAVRAMDAVSAFIASPEGGGGQVSRFVLSGGSKRGWTTWTTAAVDRRVVAIAPAVIDVLNLVPSMTHHYRAYGFWAPAVGDYVHHRIMDRIGQPRFQQLLDLVEPFSYRDRLTMPKYIVNASGDEFFLPDSSQFYFSQLPGEKHLRYVPNGDHSLDGTDAAQGLHAFYAMIAGGRPRPRMEWTREADGSLRVTASSAPSQVRLWQATNPAARDFRVETLGRLYKSAPLAPVAPNTWVARVAPPEQGWTAWFVELTFPTGGKHRFPLTTEVIVVPDTLPHGPPPGVGPAASAAGGASR